MHYKTSDRGEIISEILLLTFVFTIVSQILINSFTLKELIKVYFESHETYIQLLQCR